MSDTPRTDEQINGKPCTRFAILAGDSLRDAFVPSEFCRELERELNAANQIAKKYEDTYFECLERIKRLRDGIAKQNLEIEQTCGKVLDYTWFKDDQKNFPDTTENDGVCVGDHVAETIVAELARKYTDAKQRIKRLEEAGDSLANTQTYDRLETVNWRKAKEAKP